MTDIPAPTMIAAIDADIVCYKAAFGAITEVDWDDGEGSKKYVDLDQAIANVNDIIWEWTKQLSIKGILMCFSSPVSFRKAIFTEYKANRKDQEKPENLDKVIEYVKEKYDHLTYYGLEADDTIGILMSQPDSLYIGVSIDKDFATIPGQWLDPLGFEGLISTSFAAATRAFMIQAMTGDSTDNYKGIPGIGLKKAEKILEGVTEDHWSVILDAFIAKGLTYDDMLIQARMAFILRHEYFDDMTGEIWLWREDEKDKFDLSLLKEQSLKPKS